MTDWYYHAPGQGRVGPLPAEQLRAAFRDRRIDRDTLVWHAGLREWQPLERQFDALALEDVRPDVSQPPPLPPPAPTLRPQAAQTAVATAPAEAPLSGTSGCAIASLAVVIVGVIVIAILAAVALPAYQRYVDRARRVAQTATTGPPTFDLDDIAGNDGKVRELIGYAMLATPAQRGCAEEFELESAQLRHRDLAGEYTVDPDGGGDGHCRYRVTLAAFGNQRERMPLRYTATRRDDGVTLTCTAADLPPPLRPPGCTD